MSSLPQASRGDPAALSASSLTISALAVTGFTLVLGVLVLARVVVNSGAQEEWAASQPAPANDLAGDPSRYILHAMLLPAMDTRTSPFRWIDARATMGCHPG